MLTESATSARARSGRESRLKMVLRPVSHPQVGEIRVTGGLFAIGRNEEPFASRLGDAAARLSRRHARIFEEDGKFFVADLGSRNGTRINARPVNGGPAVLVSNDVVTFGGEVSFKVSIEHETSLDRTVMRPPSQAPARLHLVPLDPASGLETLIIERFPFLVARVGSAFESYRDRFPDAVRKLSRRHAVIAAKDDGFYIEDLASSNGTFVAGNRLDERSRKLKDGDSVVFGSDEFGYKVRIESPAPQALQESTKIVGASREQPKPSAALAPRAPEAVKAEPQAAAPKVEGAAPASAAPAAQPDSGGKTRFVSSADSFLNVFCVEDAPEESQEGRAAETAQTPRLEEPKGALGKLKAKLRPAWRLVAGEGGVSRRTTWVGAAALGLLVAVGAGAYLVSADRRSINSLLEQGDYAASAAAGNRYLASHSDDYEASAWAEEALTRATLPIWIEHIESGRYSDAAEYVDAQRERHPHIGGGLKMLDTLAWAGAVEAHMAQRKGANAPITLFRHEGEIKSLVAAWDKDSFRRQQIMEQTTSREPSFEPVQRRVYAHLRSLRTDNGLYVKAIEEFKTTLGAALGKHDWARVDKLIGDFGAEYPRVEGLDALRADVESYRSLVRVVESRELPEIIRLSRTVQFSTPLVSERADGWLARSMPPAAVLTRFEEASRAWSAGKHVDAVAALRPVTNGAWGDVVRKQIARYEKLEADYAALVAARGAADYSDRLLALWGALRPNEDAHLLRALEPDFLQHREQLVERLDASLQAIRSQWDAYQSAGGIPGVVRVEGRISERFAEQARRLSRAHAEVARGGRTYELLQLAPSAEWRSLESEIVTEAQRQRRWLEDLNIVLEPALLRAKLALLPQTSESTAWAPSTTAHEAD